MILICFIEMHFFSIFLCSIILSSYSLAVPLKSIVSELNVLEEKFLIIEKSYDLTKCEKKKCSKASELIKVLKKKISNETAMSCEDIKKMERLIEKIKNVSLNIESKNIKIQPPTQVVYKRSIDIAGIKRKILKNREDAEYTNQNNRARTFVRVVKENPFE